ncbi:lipopolysaccharide biosynthesis protein [Mucilaginibacter sp. UR6-11]|uniref:lipopolysaccharide biosynthesis protein n=1 Tax=Mucilaginibacter sp. UR6-11 TaxID=1435644 RepID=UPI001E5FF8DE|nr:oligosaccharide flippase family protein [Mucilaginibacter sp. UR6-11]MCC8423978.1 oligosaccharide flippase family protein [Mucilaginibacter sp. UR6-11]
MYPLKKTSLFIKSRNLVKRNFEAKTRTVLKNVTYSVIIKIGTIAISFLSVPLLLNYLDGSIYGVWITILTFTSWFTLFDLGLGNGLKNRLIQFAATKETDLAKSHVSTTYITMALICSSVCIFCLLVNPIVPWQLIFNIPKQLVTSVATATFIMLVFTMASLFLKLINNLLHANQQSYKVDIITFISQLVGFLAIYGARLFLKPSIVTVAIMFTLSQLLVLLIVNIYLFLRSFKSLMPSVKNFDRKLTREVVGVGGMYFLIQIAGLVMYMTDNFIISALLGPQQVTIYNLALKYFSVLTMGWGLLLTPLWPMITKAYYSADLAWIDKTHKKMIGLWGLTIVVGLIIFWCSNLFYRLWIGTTVIVPQSVSLTMLIYSYVSIFATIMATFINGIGKIKLQAYITVVLALFNIPLAIFFSRTLNWGLIGVPISTTFCLVISSVLAFIQCRKIINNASTGLWHK